MGNQPGGCNSGLCTTYEGQATDIGASNFTTAIVGYSESDGTIYAWDETNAAWHATLGGGINVAVGPRSLYAAISIFGLWEWESGDGWLNIFPYHEARDMGVGADGTYCYVGPPTSATDFNGNVTCQDLTNSISYPGTALRIDVKPDGLPVVVNEQGKVFQWVEPSGWELMPGNSMQDVAVDSSGIIWAVKKSSSDEHYLRGGEVCRWDGSSFVNAGTGIMQAIRISADGEKVWVIESDQRIISFPSW